jgi:hypothetical protein
LALGIAAFLLRGIFLAASLATRGQCGHAMRGLFRLSYPAGLASQATRLKKCEFAHSHEKKKPRIPCGVFCFEKF